MANDHHTTSLPSVSRRALLAGTAAAPIAAAPRFLSSPESTPDPVVPRWREWQRLHVLASELCHRWQEMETRLVRAIGFPQVFIPSADGSRAICAQSHSEIDQAVAAGDCSQEVGAALHAEFAIRRARWDAEAAALGFDEANRQELAAWREQEEAARTVFRTKAVTLAGVEIKLALMIQLCATFSGDPDFPLPQLRSTMADVRRLRRALDALRC
jgi:hypothetical protein